MKKGDQVKRACPICSTEFLVTPARFKYCSQRCAMLGAQRIWVESAHPKLSRTCPICGVSFLLRQRTEKKIYCSPRCAGIYRTNPIVERVCKHCSNKFVEAYAQSTQVFCSKECHYKFSRGPNSPRWVPEKVKV